MRRLVPSLGLAALRGAATSSKTRGAGPEDPADDGLTVSAKLLNLAAEVDR
jgi:hypothetical protein